jgi:hypothetical protein
VKAQQPHPHSRPTQCELVCAHEPHTDNPRTTVHGTERGPKAVANPGKQHVNTCDGPLRLACLLAAALMILLGVALAGPARRQHLDIKLTLVHCTNSSPVCLLTISNRSRAVVICQSFYSIGVLTNSVWVSRSRTEPGAAPGPFLPNQVYQDTIRLPPRAEATRVDQECECLPGPAESSAALWKGRAPWILAYRIFGTRTETNPSPTLLIAPPASPTNGA